MDDPTGELGRGKPVLTAATGRTGLTASPGPASPVRQPTEATTASPGSGICVFSGGTAANSLVDVFQAVATPASSGQPCPLTYIIPISDNGGSSSELIRFFGGPSVGDIRSRLVRLIPTGDDDPGRAALRALFEHRLCAADAVAARIEWLDLVEARHALWLRVPSATRELLRAVLNTLNLEIVKRARPSTSVFDFAGASVGNLFLTGARLFSGSFEAAIYLLSLVCGIPAHVAVLPAINSNFTHHISAGLVDGTTIAGQVNISHPSAPTSLPDGPGPDGPEPGPDGPVGAPKTTTNRHRPRASTAVDFGDATLPGSLPVLRQPHMAFSKDDDEDLPARIARVWYINPYGHEIRPQANPKMVAALGAAAAVVYSIGSLYTSIVPSLVLRGVGAAIAGAGADAGGTPYRRRRKILILNSRLDRETGPRADPMTAADFVRAIVAACRQSSSRSATTAQNSLDDSIDDNDECLRYVTHLVYLEPSPSTAATATTITTATARPSVDEAELARMGVACIGVPSQARAIRDRGGEPERKDAERYDEAALTRTLKGLVDGVE